MLKSVVCSFVLVCALISYIIQRKLSRKERRKASQIERERERETARVTGTRVHHSDPYRSVLLCLLFFVRKYAARYRVNLLGIVFTEYLQCVKEEPHL